MNNDNDNDKNEDTGWLQGGGFQPGAGGRVRKVLLHDHIGATNAGAKTPKHRLKNVFLSYNSADKEFASAVARDLAVTGTPVWFDEWDVRPGDSIPGAINDGLRTFEIFILIWSQAASQSRWVSSEMEAAVTRWIDDESIRLIPVVLDETPLPPLLSSIRYIDGKFGDHLGVVREILNIDSESKFRMAVQSFIEEAGFEFREYWGAGVYVACPHCGAEPKDLESWQQTDHERDDTYAGVRCKICGWSDGGEI